MLAASAPTATTQQCTAEVGDLLSRLQAADIPPPLSRGRFKLKMMKPDEMGEKKEKGAGGPPLGTTRGETEYSVEDASVDELQEAVPSIASADDELATTSTATAIFEDEEVYEDIPEPSEPSLLSQEEDMLFAEAVLAEAALLAEEEALAAEEASARQADAIVADAVAAEALFDEFTSLAEDIDTLEGPEAMDTTMTTPMPTKREVSLTFPPADAWYTPATTPAASASACAAPESDAAFSGKLARAVRTIQDWFTGVPFLDFEEPPSPAVVEEQVVVEAVAKKEEVENLELEVPEFQAPEFSGAMARALRVFDAGTFSPAVPAVPTVPAVPAPCGDLYDMVPMIEGDLASLEACVEEMDYASYLAFHGMEVLEGTPPQVLEMMVAEMKGSADAAETVKRMDAQDLEHAVKRSGETRSTGSSSSKWSGMASGPSAARATTTSSTSSEASSSTSSSPSAESESSSARASSLAADVERLERQIEEMASAARAAKQEADHNKEALASAYARADRIDELFAEAEKWRLAAETAESKRVEFENEQSEKKAAFVRDAESKIAEARQAAEAFEAQALGLRSELEEERKKAKEKTARPEDVSARVRTLKSALAEKTAALAKAERDALHLARVADQTAALSSGASSEKMTPNEDAVRVARLAAAEAAEDAAAKITEAAEKLLDAKKKAARAEEAARLKDDELAGVRAELEEAYARAADSRRAEKEAKEAAAAAAFCAAAGLIAAMRREDVNAMVFA